ncbi:MAG: peptide chain release factor N(5)-glutamine methyltransferase [Gammaproteobacteria bacterium]|nr:peptide chain release factor N(5)-glutamine methyltransferase [Gammaproteobacteria bacterium]
MTRAGDFCFELRRQLAASPSADLDAELLLAHVLGCSRAALAAAPERELNAAQAQALADLAARRRDGEPVAYLTGRRAFWTLDLEVTPDVLVPRPETELLVETALEELRAVAAPAVLDLGTGSGAIALAIASERPDAFVTAVDSSLAALAIAARNANRLQIGNVRFLHGYWYGPAVQDRYHAIVSNPPYVADNDPLLAALACEPRAALVAGPEGLDALAEVCAGAPPQLATGGLLIVEHGAGQGAAVRAMMTGAGLRRVATLNDLAGMPRATRGNVD